MNTNTSIYISVGIGLTAAGLYWAARHHQRNRSVWMRTQRKVSGVAKDLSRAISIATYLMERGRKEAERQKKGILEAVEAGRHAYEHAVA